MVVVLVTKNNWKSYMDGPEWNDRKQTLGSISLSFYLNCFVVFFYFIMQCIFLPDLSIILYIMWIMSLCVVMCVCFGMHGCVCVCVCGGQWSLIAHEWYILLGNTIRVKNTQYIRLVCRIERKNSIMESHFLHRYMIELLELFSYVYCLWDIW